MPLTLVQPTLPSDSVKKAFKSLLHDSTLVGSPLFREFWLEVGPDSVMLEQLVAAYLERGSIEDAREVFDAMESPSIVLERTLLWKEARSYNRDVFPLSVPPEQWQSKQPFLFSGTYEEWDAGRIEFILDHEVTVRGRRVRPSGVQFGTLFLDESKFPRRPKAGDYFEAVNANGIWEIRMHDLTEPECELLFRD